MPRSEPSRASAFAADVFKLVTGTTLAQAVAVLASPLLTRLYGPEAFGFLALFISITSILGVVACMRYELAIMLPQDDREAANLLALSLLSTVIVSGLTVPALYFGGISSSPSSGLQVLPPTSFWSRRTSSSAESSSR
jgi:lipopolysaccharide exporter